MDVAVFMDWQNVYRAARDAFELRQAPPERGNFNPLTVARYLAAGNKRGQAANLVRVEIHRGLPPPNTNPKGHGAADRQRKAWEALDPEVMSVKLRPVRVNPETGEEEEKGIDVALACSAVEHVLLDKCQVAIIFSHDTDLLPPVETICRVKGSDRVETASWQSDFYFKRIPPAKQVWGTPFGVVNHTLKVEMFDKVENPVNYAEGL
ncbi:MAG TPA: NYN domain-containing protein [Gaiellaceae bacterium]